MSERSEDWAWIRTLLGIKEGQSVQFAIETLQAELTAAEEEIIRVKGLVIERDGWLPQEERIRLETELQQAREALRNIGKNSSSTYARCVVDQYFAMNPPAEGK